MRRSIALLGLCITLVAANPAAAGPAAMGVSTARPLRSADWLQYRFDATRSGFNPNEHVLTASNVGSLEAIWVRRNLGAWGNPAIAGDTVYINAGGDTGEVIALNIDTGDTKWVAPLNDWFNGLDLSPAISGSSLYATAVSSLHAIDVRSGGSQWIDPLTDVTTATVAGQRVYLSDGKGDLAAFDHASGMLRWKTANVSGGIAATVAGGTVFVRTNTCHLAALNAKTGKVLWEVRPNGDCLDTVPVAAGRLVVEVASSAGMYAFDPPTGALVWHLSDPFLYGASPVSANGVLYATDQTSMYAIDAVTGVVLWTRELLLHPLTSLTLANGVLYYGYAGGIAFVDGSSGVALGSVAIRGDFDYAKFAFPIVAEGKVFVITTVPHHPHGTRGFVYAFGLPSGR